MWYYDTPIGRLFIVKTPEGEYGFAYNGIIWEACPTPQEEVSNINVHVTGCVTWDLCDIEVPDDLSEWIYVSHPR